MSKKIEIEESSGNVFADIGLPNPEERIAKADLAIRIAETIRARRLTQTARSAEKWQKRFGAMYRTDAWT
jgi:hypothetical protein